MTFRENFQSFPFIHRVLEEVEELAKRHDLKEQLDRTQYQNGQMLATFQKFSQYRRYEAVSVAQMCTDTENLFAEKDEKIATLMEENKRLGTASSEAAQQVDRIAHKLRGILALNSEASFEGKIDFMLKKLQTYEPNNESIPLGEELPVADPIASQASMIQKIHDALDRIGAPKTTVGGPAGSLIALNILERISYCKSRDLAAESSRDKRPVAPTDMADYNTAREMLKNIPNLDRYDMLTEKVRFMLEYIRTRFTGTGAHNWNRFMPNEQLKPPPDKQPRSERTGGSGRPSISEQMDRSPVEDGQKDSAGRTIDNSSDPKSHNDRSDRTSSQPYNYGDDNKADT